MLAHVSSVQQYRNVLHVFLVFIIIKANAYPTALTVQRLLILSQTIVIFAIQIV